MLSKATLDSERLGSNPSNSLEIFQAKGILYSKNYVNKVHKMFLGPYHCRQKSSL